MNENETDPQSADAGTEGSVDARQSSSAQRGQSEEPTAAQPTAHLNASPQSGAPQSATPDTSATHQFPATPQTSGAPAASDPTAAAPSTAGQWTQPQAQSPWPSAHQPQGYGQQPGYAGYPQYGQAGYQQSYGQHSAYAAWAQQHGATHQAPPTTQQMPAAEGQPAWAAPVGGAVHDPARTGKGRRMLATGAAAVLIALAGGGVGAATVLALEPTNAGAPTVKTGNSAVTRVVDRSSLAQIAAAVQDSVVSITTGSGEGSGVVLSADGYIVTNNHVVATAQGKDVTVIFADGKKATASIVGTDPRTDLAVVKATGVANLKAATFGSSARMQVGDTVLAIGSPLGLEGSVTAGIISAKDRTIQSSGEQQQQPPWGGNQQQGAPPTTMSGLLQTDAPINPGNSGGALVNTNGEVIGINSAIATQGAGSGNIGLGFAIPSDKAKQVADQLMAGKKVSHPALGVSVTDAENGGALVRSVTPNSAAAKAGLQQGDVVNSVDGKGINDANDLVAAVQGGTVGQKMTIEYSRSGEKKTVAVTLTETQ